jgi:OOP family OmpA-OmpF porin
MADRKTAGSVPTMCNMKTFLLMILSGSFFVMSDAFALEIDKKALESKTDLKGGKDHPIASRLPGSWIVQYSEKEFDQMQIALGSALDGKKFEKTDSVEGKVTRVGYALPAGRSSFEALRQYEAALQKAGFKRLYGCRGEECGSLFNQAFETLPGEENDFYYYDLEQNSLYYSTWKLTRSEGDVHVMLVTFAPNEIRQVENSFAFVRIAEVKGMQEGLVTVDAASMQKGIATEGHVALYGIQFDFNKADIKPESTSTLEEISGLLKQNSQWKIFVVGHTDNVGTYEYNMDLSQRRARAVVTALSTQYGIQAARLRSAGVGPVAPVASNESEEGRAENRRVELVKQ